MLPTSEKFSKSTWYLEAFKCLMKLKYCEMLGLGEAPVNKYRSRLHLNHETFTSLKSFKTDPTQQMHPGNCSSMKDLCKQEKVIYCDLTTIKYTQCQEQGANLGRWQLWHFQAIWSEPLHFVGQHRINQFSLLLRKHLKYVFCIWLLSRLSQVPSSVYLV